MSRTSRIAGSFAIMMIAYWAYALLAVPLIEPSVDRQLSLGEITEADRENAKKLADDQVERVRKHFPRGGLKALGLTDPKILESNQAKLLFQSYEHRRDGSVVLRPCVIIFETKETSGESNPVILEARGGAILQFDPPLDINHVKIGRLVQGRLVGDVIIRSEWKLPGPEDDLLITTRDVKLTEQTISTLHPVDFSWGPHFGRGRNMTIRLLVGETRSGAKTAGPKIEGVESFELRKVERLHVDLDAGKRTDAQGGMPVEISCHGPFIFDVLNHVATFSDRVDVMKPNPDGPADQIACDQLSMHFVARNPDEGREAKPGSLDLIAERLECLGKPVVVTAPSRKMNARAPRIEYNLLTESIALDGDKDVFIQQGSNEIHARSVFYQIDKRRSIGQLLAQGPGWLRGRLDETTDQQIEAVWNNRLQIYPNKKKHVISLDGGAELKYHDIGQLQAKEIFFWLEEAPTTIGDKQLSMRPDRMLARDDVRLNSPQLSGKVNQLEVWFEQIEQPVQGMEVVNMANNAPHIGAVGAAAQSPLKSPLTGDTSRRFEVAGRLLRVKALLGGPQVSLSNLLVMDGVTFREVQTARAGEKPLLVTGDLLEVSNATEKNAMVKIVGKPARFEARGLGLTGSNINLDRGKNLLWIDGPGRMDMPIPEKVSDEMHFAAGGRLTVDWKKRMEFDGHTAEFEESVVAAGPAQQLRTKRMEVQLLRRIDFSKSSVPEDSEVEKVSCFGEVTMENRRYDDRQQLAAFDRMRVDDMAINVRSGALTAGPGWFSSVSLGKEEDSFNPMAPTAAKTRNTAQPGQDQLYCLTVKYQGSLTGNLDRSRWQLTFNNEVHAARAPVDDWNALLNVYNPDSLGPDGVTLRCDKLSVVEMPSPLKKQRAIEIEALGNTKVEGRTYTASGHRITYAESKDLLILEGDGRSYAELFRQLKVGSPQTKVTARKILYRPKTGQSRVIDPKTMEIGLFPDTTGTK